MSTPEPLESKRRAAVAFIFVTALIDVLSFGIIIPVLPPLVVAFAGGDPVHGARIYGLFGTAWALMQFVFSPLLGALSDRFGRRPVILLSCFGLGLDYLFMAFAPTLAWLFVGRIISGITAANFSTASAYIADVTPPEKRAGAFGLVGAAWGFGFVLGPALGGFLGAIEPRLAFVGAAVLALLNALYGLFVLPESLPHEKRSAFSWKRANPLGSLTLLRSQTQLLGLAGVNLLYWLAHNVLPSAFVLYAGYRYGWNARTMGLLLAATGICNILVQIGLIKPVVARLGERRTLLAGLLFGAIGFAMYGLAPNGTLVWFCVPVFSLIGLFGPASQALMTRLVSPSQQGQLQGANGCVMALTGLIGPALFTLTFAHFIEPERSWKLPGAPFLLAAALTFLALILAWRVTRKSAAAGGKGAAVGATAAL
ncbi:MAG: transporter [Nevskia sp.]|nr:transporter [Nevskia sp.]